jgi:polyisoprenoid-binding protein YceI
MMGNLTLFRSHIGRSLLALTTVLAVTRPAHAQEGSWTVSAAKVTVVCPLTVGGNFEAKTTALSGTLTRANDPGAPLGGELSVDLRTLDTGIGLRNTHMRDNYLQVDAQPGFDRAVLSAIPASLAAASGRRERFTARLTLHGVTREVTGDAVVRRQGTNLQVEASFTVRLSEFQIPEPRYLGVGVRDQVSIRVTFTALSAPGRSQ